MAEGALLRKVRAGEKSRGVNYTTLACQASVLTPYVRDHLSHAAQAIEELYTQLPSPVTPDAAQRAHWEAERETYVARICEAVERLAAALTSMGCTDGEMEKLLACKEEANEKEIDTPSVASDITEEHTAEAESDSDEAVLAESLVEGRTTVP